MKTLLALSLLALGAAAEEISFAYADGKLTLTWPKVEDADGYLVYRIEHLKESVVARPGEPRCTLDAERFTLATYEVRWKNAGAETAVGRVLAHTYPPYFKVGTFTLDVFGRETWRFEEDRAYEGHKGDIAIVSAQGGGSILKVRGLFGIAAGTPGGFGRIDPTKRAALAKELEPGEVEIRETRPETLEFRLRSGEGGFLHVRAAKLESPRATFEYVYVMRPEVEDILRELAAVPADAAAENKVAGLLDNLLSADTNERLTAEEAIVAAGPGVAGFLGKQIREHAKAEVRDRLEALLRRIWERHPQAMK